MKRNNKKYIIRESELKEIIREMVLNEIESTDVASYTTDVQKKIRQGQNPEFHTKDLINMAKGLVAPEKLRKAVEDGDSGFLKWLFGALGLNYTPGAVGPDYVPNVSTWMNGGGWGKGNNQDAKEKFNVQRAVQYIWAHSANQYTPSTSGWCAKRVREALNHGGLRAPWGMPAPSAKYYIGILPRNGWEEINPSQAGQAGDIVVLAPYTTPETGRYHKDGHIAMCCGNGRWVSDFKQKNMYGMYGSVPPEAVHVYRYKNIE